jgi:hypothetical protein
MASEIDLSKRDFLRRSGIVGLGALALFFSMPKSLEGKSYSDIPQPEIIDGVETYGHGSPLLQEEVNTLLAFLNNEFAGKKIVMEDDTYYSTEAVDTYDYQRIPEIMGESYQSFLSRHDSELNRILIEAGLGGGLVNRRLLILDPSAEISASYHLLWLGDQGLRDSDGSEGLWFTKPYDPTKTYYYDPETRIDWGRIHEECHHVLHLPDVYAIDGDFTAEQNATPSSLPAFEEISEEWQSYFTSARNDNRRGIMNTITDWRFCAYSIEMLARRVKEGWTHDMRRTIPEGGWDFPNEFAPSNILVLGEQFNEADVTIYRSSGTYSSKTMEDEVFKGVVKDGRIDIANPFSGVQLNDGLVPSYNALLFMRVESEGSVWFRYLDTGDLSLAFWNGIKNESSSVTLAMELAHNEISPTDFDWVINKDFRVNLPLINHA